MYAVLQVCKCAIPEMCNARSVIAKSFKDGLYVQLSYRWLSVMLCMLLLE